MKKNIEVINVEPKPKTISFWELLKLKIANQTDEISNGFTYFSLGLSILNILLLNCNYVEIGMHSKTLSQQTGNFWITLILILPFLFLSLASFVFCFLSRLRKTEFVGRLSFFVCIFNLIVVFFFLIFISAVF